ncbi:MAG: thioredoxin domain-containing protein [Anaerolineae bacterium]|nr:thioredoxin domain-containing protein [Anaerolineae bacterium]MBT7191372.1 thioredoxin domain-containing protein [Anaerolineae bacterium]MBT7991785.1 thioredoxin domain-containing protein [Anaerolineae bacterium]
MKDIRKETIYFLFLMIFFISACAPNPAATPTPTTPPVIFPQTPTPFVPECSSIETIPTPAASDASLFPPVSDADMVLGPTNAATTFLFYGDFQDPPSAELALVLIKLREKYPEDLQIIFRDFPLVTNPGHEKAAYAAHASHAAALQGKYWEMHDSLFIKQAEWSLLSIKDFRAWLSLEASLLSMDAAQLAADMEREDIIEKVKESFILANEVGLPGTPFVLINGQIYAGNLSFDALDQIISLILLGERQYTSCPQMVIDPEKEYLAVLETGNGEIVIQFYPASAPIAVNNFVFLAQAGWYNGITFHRVVPDYFAETGDPSGTGQGNPGYFFKNEIDPSLSFNRPGVMAMKNIGENTNGSQFFITYDAVPSYDGKYTIFGQVLSGIDVLEELSPRDPKIGEILPSGDTLLNVTIEER